MPADPTSPYIGLRPFREEDRPFFFGRERDTRVIATNVMEEPLTVLYGASGAGKSSVLQAGVVPHIRQLSNVAVVYFRNWQSDSLLEEIQATIVKTITSDLADLLANSGRKVFLLLDQFEEYLLYHSENQKAHKFDGLLAQLVNRDDIPVKVLIGIREDGLSKLNERFYIRIPDLLNNTLQVERLSVEAARNAIEKPLEIFNTMPAAAGYTFSIEPALTEAVLEQVQEGRTSVSDSSGLGTRSAKVAQIETAYLQLVLTQLWYAERQEGSTVMRLETLTRLGGASQIVRDHVQSVMQRLENDEERDIAARLFLYLVTPSRSKIAQRTEDLVCFGEAPDENVKNVLNTLAAKEESRILRRLSNPEQYEIFHDVLAQHILEWRRGYDEEKRLKKLEQEQQAEAARKQHELEQAQALAGEQQLRADQQAAAARKFRILAVYLVVLTILAVLAAVYGFWEKRQADEYATQANRNAQDADTAKEVANSEKSRAEAVLQQLQAVNAEKEGKTQEAIMLREAAALSQQQADLAAQRAHQQGSVATSMAEELAQAKADRDKNALQVQSLQKTLDDTQHKLENAQAELLKLQPKPANPSPTVQRLASDPKADKVDQGKVATQTQAPAKPSIDYTRVPITWEVIHKDDFFTTLKRGNLFKKGELTLKHAPEQLAINGNIFDENIVIAVFISNDLESRYKADRKSTRLNSS